MCIKINNVKRTLIKHRIDEQRYPLYNHGFMDLNTQYSTTGVNGINEACELLDKNVLHNDGQAFIMKMLDLINNLNDKATIKYGVPHNCEQVPSENSSIKFKNI